MRMASWETVCESCANCRYIPGRTNAPPEDCYPPEEYCEEDSDNFGTTDGCYRYEERCEHR
jgi:hypothetical protein